MARGSEEALTVSVALCTRNGEAFIVDQLLSILNQTVPPREIILSDDDSADLTVEFATATMREFSAGHPDRTLEFQILRNRPALGVSQNFAQAIAHCNSDLIALSDQDDVWVPNRLEWIGAVFADTPAVTLVSSDARLVDAAGEPIGHSLFQALRVTSWELSSLAQGWPVRALVRRNLITGATVVFRRELARVALPVPSGWIHDEWLGILAASIGAIAVDRRALIDYRQHSANQIGASKPTIKRRLQKLQEPRAERNHNLLVRANELVARLTALGDRVNAQTLSLARGKLNHEVHRSAIPARRIRRVIPVFAIAIRGDYRRYGLGAQDVLRDLVQPAG